jgi:hypothetical protein
MRAPRTRPRVCVCVGMCARARLPLEDRAACRGDHRRGRRAELEIGIGANLRAPARCGRRHATRTGHHVDVSGQHAACGVHHSTSSVRPTSATCRPARGSVARATVAAADVPRGHAACRVGAKCATAKDATAQTPARPSACDAALPRANAPAARRRAQRTETAEDTSIPSDRIVTDRA